MTKTILKDGEALARAAAEHFIRLASEAIAARGRFTVALSGGTTPKRLHTLLANEFRRKVDWSKVFVFFGDERFLAPYDTDSNYYMADETLLSEVDIPPENVFPFITLEVTPEESAAIYASELSRFFDETPPRLDLIFLGLGEDGHTASLFPDNEVITASPDTLVVAVHNSPKPPAERMTLSLNTINAARTVIFLVAGTGKRETLQRIENGEALPASLVNPEGTLLWLVDEAAAG